jgi:hypothetical protein
MESHFLWDAEGVILVYFILCIPTINSDLYIQNLIPCRSISGEFDLNKNIDEFLL